MYMEKVLNPAQYDQHQQNDQDDPEDTHGYFPSLHDSFTLASSSL